MDRKRPTPTHFKSRYVRWASTQVSDGATEPTTEQSDGANSSCRGDCAARHGSIAFQKSNESAILDAINKITEKFELVNKFQLPKLTSALLQLKSATDRIVKQNDEILKNIADLQSSAAKKTCAENDNQNRPRKLLHLPNLTRKTKLKYETPNLPVPEKVARYRRKRSPYVLHKILIIFNNHMLKSKQHRNNRRHSPK